MSRADAPPSYPPLFTGFWSLRVSVILKTRLVHQQVRVQTVQVFPVLMGHCVTLHDYRVIKSFYTWDDDGTEKEVLVIPRKRKKETRGVNWSGVYDTLWLTPSDKICNFCSQRTACAVLLDKFHTFLNSRLNEERTPAFSDHWNIKKNVICRIKAQKKINIFTKCETSSCSVLRANTMIISTFTDIVSMIKSKYVSQHSAGITQRQFLSVMPHCMR